MFGVAAPLFRVVWGRIAGIPVIPACLGPLRVGIAGNADFELFVYLLIIGSFVNYVLIIC